MQQNNLKKVKSEETILASDCRQRSNLNFEIGLFLGSMSNVGVELIK